MRLITGQVHLMIRQPVVRLVGWSIHQELTAVYGDCSHLFIISFQRLSSFLSSLGLRLAGSNHLNKLRSKDHGHSTPASDSRLMTFYAYTPII